MAGAISFPATCRPNEGGIRRGVPGGGTGTLRAPLRRGGLARSAAAPGLHYPAPWPFARANRWPVREVKSVTSGAADEYPVYKVFPKMGYSHGTIEHRVNRYVSGLGAVA